MAGRRAVSAAQGRADEAAEHDPEYAKAAPGPDPPTYLTHPTYSTYLTPVKSPACQPWLRIARRRACAKPTGCVVPTRTCQREGMGSR